MMPSGLFRSKIILILFTFFSRTLGFIRDILIAHILGAGAALDAFFVAFKMPNLLRRLYAEGVIAQNLIPVLHDYKQKDAEFRLVVTKVLGTLGTIFLILTLMLFIFAPTWISFIAPGYRHDPQQVALSALLLRIMSPYMVCIAIAAIAISVFNLFERFILGAVLPMILNISLIVLIVFFAEKVSQPVLLLAWGTLGAGLIQLTLIFLNNPVKKLPPLKTLFDLRHPAVHAVTRGILPGIIAISMLYAGFLIDMMFATSLAAGNVSWFYYAERLIVFPISIIGTSFALVHLPDLLSEKNNRHKLVYPLEQILTLGVPASIGLYVLSYPITATLFGGGKFTPDDIAGVAKIVQAFALGIPGFLMIKLLVNGFFVNKQIKTPFICALGAIAVNIMLNFLLIKPLKGQGLAFATSVAGWFNATLLFYFLRKENKLSFPGSWYLKMLMGNGVMLLILLFLHHEEYQWLKRPPSERFFHLLLLVMISITSYFIIFMLPKIKKYLLSPS